MKVRKCVRQQQGKASSTGASNWISFFFFTRVDEVLDSFGTNGFLFCFILKKNEKKKDHLVVFSYLKNRGSEECDDRAPGKEFVNTCTSDVSPYTDSVLAGVGQHQRPLLGSLSLFKLLVESPCPTFW